MHFISFVLIYSLWWLRLRQCANIFFRERHPRRYTVTLKTKSLPFGRGSRVTSRGSRVNGTTRYAPPQSFAASRHTVCRPARSRTKTSASQEGNNQTVRSASAWCWREKRQEWRTDCIQRWDRDPVAVLSKSHAASSWNKTKNYHREEWNE